MRMLHDRRRRRGDNAADRVANIPFLIDTVGALAFQDTGGTTPAAVGDPVYLVRDVSGNGNDGVAPSSGARPTVLASNALSYDGTNDQLTFTATLPSDCEVFAVAESGGEGIIIDTDPAASDTHLMRATTGTASINAGVGAVSTYVDGALITNTAVSLLNAIAVAGPHVIHVPGADISSYSGLIISGNTSVRFTGGIGGLVVYDNANGALTEQQVADIRTYMLDGLV